MADEMPPPMAPADIICISMKPGNTSAMPASASVPSRPMNAVSISPVDACASITSTLGPASRSRVAQDGAVQQPQGARRVHRDGAGGGGSRHIVRGQNVHMHVLWEHEH